MNSHAPDDESRNGITFKKTYQLVRILFFFLARKVFLRVHKSNTRGSHPLSTSTLIFPKTFIFDHVGIFKKKIRAPILRMNFFCHLSEEFFLELHKKKIPKDETKFC